MPQNGTILCLASYFKGEEFLRECKRRGWRVIFLTTEKLENEPWPRESIDEFLMMPSLTHRDEVIRGVSYLARTRVLDRVVPLDEFDLETGAALREHLRVPGMGDTTARYFRDKLAMRLQARERGFLVPDFSPVFNHDALRDFTARVSPPWLLKPRSSAAAIGIKKVESAEELWPLLESLGDEQSFHVLEQFVPGEIFHVDSVVCRGQVLFSVVSGYGQPPMRVAHEGGVFTTRTLERGGADEVELKRLNGELIRALGLVQGVTHAEFIRGGAAGKEADGGRFYFLEIAARVAGAHIAEVVEAATGLSLWREWARVETATAEHPYRLPEIRSGYAGSLICLARQEWPDTSAYDAPEVVWRLKKRHHAGLIVAADDPARVKALLEEYAPRFQEDFYARLPPPEKPSS
jgi:glutathione synthase/RimK-type ligase-like ATP-grasp enzyme